MEDIKRFYKDYRVRLGITTVVAVICGLYGRSLLEEFATKEVKTYTDIRCAVIYFEGHRDVDGSCVPTIVEDILRYWAKPADQLTPMPFDQAYSAQEA